MSNTEFELMTALAKAAGFEVVGPVERFVVQPDRRHVGGLIIANKMGGHSCWNPRGDSGDALGLAVRLGLDLSVFHEDSSLNCGRWSTEKGVQWPSPIPFGEDPDAAAREAIWRAAAQIVEAKKP